MPANGMDEVLQTKLVQQCDALIKELSHETSSCCDLCDQADKFGSELVSRRQNASESDPNAQEFAMLLQHATTASVRCAQLLEKALQVAGKFSNTQQRIVKAIQSSSTADQEDQAMEQANDDIEENDENDEEDEESTLLLSDLVVAAEQMDKANRQLSQLGVVRKSLQMSRKLLVGADDSLAQHHGSSTTTTTAPATDQVDRKAFGDLYMEEFTSAFGDELDQFRQEESFESKDVSFLIASIHAGADLFSPLQKRLLLSASTTEDASS